MTVFNNQIKDGSWKCHISQLKVQKSKIVKSVLPVILVYIDAFILYNVLEQGDMLFLSI